jgi:hypothetical protein
LSNAAINQALKKSHQYYMECKEEALTKTTLSHAVDWFNIGSGILFISGIALTALFVGINFHEVKSMKKANTDVTLSSRQGVPQIQKTDAGPLNRGQSIPKIRPVIVPVQTTAPQGATISPGAPATAAPPNPSTLKK